tara:strand:- start:3585 stop:4028 length:444 start_codon:yes stop_codon:yes gene_type:complete
MQVIGFNFEKIEAERKKPSQGKLEVNSNINIKDISQEKLDVVKDKPVLKLSFDFKVNYKPDIAEISLQGNIILLAEKDEAKSILKNWKTKKLLEEIRVPIFNVILTKSNLKALQLEEELNLPLHLPFPKIKKDQEADSKDNNRTYAG